MTRCGCNPVSEPFEFKIGDCNHSNNPSFIELFPQNNNLQELKDKVICEYLKIIDSLECGIHLDLEFLLEEISLIEILENG